jgi:formylglycine-generating enzyme required for sulfatase activity
VGKRLPTEAEWEYAASGPENFKWPWGNQFQLNLSAAGAGSLRPVGSFPDGASPFDVLDMAGNATEWVADAYSTSFYANSPTTNPVNTQGAQKIFRGGAFDNPDGSFYTTSRRYPKSAGSVDADIGFRCAQDAPEVNEAEPQGVKGTRLTEFCKAYDVYKPGAKCP